MGVLRDAQKIFYVACGKQEYYYDAGITLEHVMPGQHQ